MTQAKKLALVSVNPNSPPVGEVPALAVESILKGFGFDVHRFNPDALISEPEFESIVYVGDRTFLETYREQMRLNPTLARTIKDFYKVQKPIGFVGGASALLAKILGGKGASYTLGLIDSPPDDLVKAGGYHIRCAPTDFVSDRDHKVASTTGEDVSGLTKMGRELWEMS